MGAGGIPVVAQAGRHRPRVDSACLRPRRTAGPPVPGDRGYHCSADPALRQPPRRRRSGRAAGGCGGRCHLHRRR
ncbi:hypothetical protein G6F66_015648 [Rhizopus arrhizus]|nr:hypothetical protein G6F66_015648 [Rhizopus arrhizus]